MKAFVLCANDRVEAVVLDDADRAESELKKLRDKYWESRKHSFDSEEEFDAIVFWRIHNVEVI